MLAWILVGAAMADEPVEVLTSGRTWTTVHDTVMGGVSHGKVEKLDDSGAVRFSGVVSLDHGGGFASARSTPAPLGLDGIETFRLELTGDSRVWSFTVRRDDVHIRAGSWRVELTTTGERQVFEIPVTDFEAVSRGRRVPDGPPLVGATGHIDSVGFLVGKRQAGPFSLTVHRISAE